MRRQLVQHLFHGDARAHDIGSGGLGFGTPTGLRFALLRRGQAFLQHGERLRIGAHACRRRLRRGRVRSGARREGELHLVFALGALLRRLRRRGFGRRRVERLARQGLLGGDARLQGGRGARLGLGSLGRQQLVFSLGIESRLMLTNGFLFRLFALARHAQRLGVGFRARLRAAPQLGVERRALARRIARARLGFGRAARFALARLLRGDAILQRRGRRGLAGGERLRRRAAALLGFDTRLRRRFRRGLRLLALARKARGVGFGAHALFRRAARRVFGLLALFGHGQRPCLRSGKGFRSFGQSGIGFRARERRRREGLLGRRALLGELQRAIAGLDARLRFLQRARLRRLALERQLQRRGFGFGARLRALGGLCVLRLALAHRGDGAALGGGALLGRRARLLLRRRARACELGRGALDPAALLGHRARARLGGDARLRLLRGGALVLDALLGEAPGLDLGGDARLGLAPLLFFRGLALACRLERLGLAVRALARGAPRLLFRSGALLHRRRRRGFRFGARPGVLRRLFLFLLAAGGERRRLLLRLLALARFRRGRRLGALALGDQARGLGLGFGARVRHAPQLDFRRLALARQVQAATLLAGARLRDFLGALLAFHALALGALQLVQKLAHFVALLLFRGCCLGQLGRADFRLGRRGRRGRRGRSRGRCWRSRLCGAFRSEIQVDEIAERVRIGLAHFLHHRQRLLEGLDQLRVEFPPGAAGDLLRGLVHRDRVAVELGGRHRLERIDDRHHAPAPRNGVALKARGIAGAVVILVVREGKLARELEQRVGVLADDLGAERGVAAHALPVGHRQFLGLAQDLRRHAELADVVQRRGLLHHLGDLGPRTGRLRDQLGVVPQAHDAVADRRAFVELHRPRQALDELGARFLELGGARLH